MKIQITKKGETKQIETEQIETAQVEADEAATRRSKMNIRNVVAVPEMEAGQTAGAITLWTLSGEVEHEALRRAWTGQGRSEGLLPALPSPQVALHRAMLDERGPRVLVRPLAGGHGYALVAESAVEDDLTHRITLRARVDSDSIQIDADDPAADAAAQRIAAGFARYSATHAAADIGSWLVRRVYGCSAVAIRATGGVYFVPRDRVEEWRGVARALESASACRVYEIPALHSASAVECVMAALAAEAEEEATKIEEQITEVGTRGLRTRSDRVGELVQKVGGYEALLGRHQSALHDRLEHLQAAIAQAILASEEADEGAGR